MWLLREESQRAVICQAKTPSSYIIHTTERLVHTLTLPGTLTDKGRAPYATSSGRVSQPRAFVEKMQKHLQLG